MLSAIYPGRRVGVILEENYRLVRWMGYGLYVRDEMPQAPSVRGVAARLAKEKVPRIELDSGLVIWGWEATCIGNVHDMGITLCQIFDAQLKDIRKVTESQLNRIRFIRQRRLDILREEGGTLWAIERLNPGVW